MHNCLDWNDLRLVLEVLRAGTFLGASRALGLSHSTVSRRIAALEATLGTRLVERTPDGLLATAAGESVRVVAERTEADVQGLRHAIDGRDMRLRGPLRVAMPYLLATDLLMPSLAEFARRIPTSSSSWWRATSTPI